MSTIQGLKEYGLKDIENIVLSHFNSLRANFHFEDLDFSIQNIEPFGSRIAGTSKYNSDLDIKITYTGEAREDDLFNALNDKSVKLKIENIKVDFYPEKLRTQTFPRHVD